MGVGCCGEVGEEEEGTHFALACIFGEDASALRGRWHLGRQAHPGSTTNDNNTQEEEEDAMQEEVQGIMYVDRGYNTEIKA